MILSTKFIIFRCTNVPESLFEPNAASKHFSKFGRVVRIKLFPRKQACVIEFDQPSAIERAVLNAGAYDGFMFDVTRMKARVLVFHVVYYFGIYFHFVMAYAPSHSIVDF